MSHAPPILMTKLKHISWFNRTLFLFNSELTRVKFFKLDSHNPLNFLAEIDLLLIRNDFSPVKHRKHPESYNLKLKVLNRL